MALTEAWNADPRSSQNHFMLGQIMEWFYADLAGLAPDPAFPGFERVQVRPQPIAGITWTRASYASPRGRVSVSWRLEKGAFHLDLTVPPNASAEVGMPTTDVSSVREGGRPLDQVSNVRPVRQDAGRAVIKAGSGRYAFSATAPALTPAGER